MSVFASPSKTTVDMDEINKVLWPVYVRAALRGATISRCEVVGTVQKREWLKLLRGSGLDGAQATLVYYAETAKHERRCFTYSAFKSALLQAHTAIMDQGSASLPTPAPASRMIPYCRVSTAGLRRKTSGRQGLRC